MLLHTAAQCQHIQVDIGLGDSAQMMLKFQEITQKLTKKEQLKLKKLAKYTIESFILQYFVFQTLLKN